MNELTLWYSHINEIQLSILDDVSYHFTEHDKQKVKFYLFPNDQKLSLISVLMQRSLIMKTFNLSPTEFSIERTQEV